MDYRNFSWNIIYYTYTTLPPCLICFIPWGNDRIKVATFWSPVFMVVYQRAPEARDIICMASEAQKNHRSILVSWESYIYLIYSKILSQRVMSTRMLTLWRLVRIFDDIVDTCWLTALAKFGTSSKPIPLLPTFGGETLRSNTYIDCSSIGWLHYCPSVPALNVEAILSFDGLMMPK